VRKFVQTFSSIIITQRHGKETVEFVELKDLLVSHIHYHGAIVNPARVVVLIAQTIVVSF